MTVRYFRPSEVKKFKRCPRSWWLSYQRSGYGWKPAPSDRPASGQRDVGTLFHSCVEAYRNPPEGINGSTAWRTVLHVARLALAHDLGVGLVSVLPKEWQQTFDLVERMVEGYIEWLESEGSDAGETTLATELEITLPIGTIRGDEVFLVMHLDHLIRNDITGQVIVSDYKTVQSFDQAADILQIDTQGLIYCMGATHHLGEKVRTFRHDMARKVKRTATAKPPFYARQEVHYSEQQIDSAWKHLVATLDRMVEALQRLEFSEDTHHTAITPTPNRDCTWDCDFLAVCPMFDEGSHWRKAIEDSGLFVRREGKRDDG